MTSPSFAADLALYGPQQQTAQQQPALSRAAARDYCRRLAHTHYENFTVASWLLPKHLRPHFYNIYAYCRWSDDLADETGDPAESLRLLAWWQQQLEACYQGQATHPVFIALQETIEQFQIPTAPLADLLTAFRQDQTVTRYETLDDLLGYCRCSANPVGRLVLYLGRCHDERTAALSDQICTGLQLANFWQDVAGDYERGRIYLPAGACRRAGYDEAMFARREFNPAFRQLLGEQVAQAEKFFDAGEPLVRLVSPELRIDVALFIAGGRAILRQIRAVDFDVWSRRPEVSKWEKLRLLWTCWRQARRAKPLGSGV